VTFAAYGSGKWVDLSNGLRPTGPFTFGAWCRAAAWNGQEGWLIGGDWTDAALEIENGGTPRLFVNGIDIHAVTVLSVNVTHFVVGTYDGSNARLYSDGLLIGGPIAAPAPVPMGLFGIAAGYGDNYRFNGTIDEPAIWNRALSAAEIAELYRIGSGT
jgi:hypothetical protein